MNADAHTDADPPLASSGVVAPRRPLASSFHRGRRNREILLGFALVSPALIFLGVFEFFPIFFGLFISTCDWRLGCARSVGLENYTRALADPAMWESLGVTAVYSVISVPVQLAVSFFVAYLLFQKIRGLQAFRVLYFMPYITSMVASAAVWSYLYSPDKGLINWLLSRVGIKPLRWLSEPTGVFALIARDAGVALPSWAAGPSLALVALIVYTTWVFVGYDTTIFLAGLGNIPKELYDAAKVDGAAGWTLMRYVTLPLLSPTSFFLLILTIVGTFKAFNHIWVMTQGGPGAATTTASVYIFQQLYQYNRYGYSAALSFILFFIILVFTVIQNRTTGRGVVYD